MHIKHLPAHAFPVRRTRFRKQHAPPGCLVLCQNLPITATPQLPFKVPSSFESAPLLPATGRATGLLGQGQGSVRDRRFLRNEMRRGTRPNKNGHQRHTTNGHAARTYATTEENQAWPTTPWHSPRNETFFFVISSSPGTFYVGSCGIALNSTT